MALSNPFKLVDLFLAINGTDKVAVKSVLSKGSTIFQALLDLKLVSLSFNYSNNNSTINNKKYVMIRLVKNVYSAGIDPK